jgi:hypothetical protein
MNIMVMDGQGGQLGCSLIKTIYDKLPTADITAVGTNAGATAAMIKAGAKKAATGENPVVVASKKADVIIGPVGIVIADSIWGEITPAMALAIGQSRAVRVLIPMNQCSNIIAGVEAGSAGALIRKAIEQIGLAMNGCRWYNE